MPSNNLHVGDIQTDINRVKQDQTYLFVDRGFQESIIEYFQFLRREGILCDVTLRVGTHKFLCHRNILGVACPYFRSLFIDSETGRFIKNVDLPREIDRSTMDALLGYMYGGRIFINSANAVDIFKGASFFKLQSLLEECSYLLVKFLTPENCLRIRDVSEVHGQETLHQRCLRFVYNKFVNVVNSAHFLELPQDELEKLLSNSDIYVSSEHQVFDSLVRWTEYDRKERGIHFAKLLQHVRLPLLPTRTLMDHIERHELVQRSPTAKEMVMEALRYNTAQENQQTSLSSPRTVPRTCSTLVEVILFIGGKGRNTEEGRVAFCYEPDEDRWYTLAPLRTQLYDHSVAVVDGFVYAGAGSMEGKASLLLQSNVQCYNPILNHWELVAPLQEARAKAASTDHDGLLYVSDMKEFRQDAQAVVFNNKIYVIGGRDYNGERVLDSIESFDVSQGEWNQVTSVPVAREGFRCVTCRVSHNHLTPLKLR